MGSPSLVTKSDRDHDYLNEFEDGMTWDWINQAPTDNSNVSFTLSSSLAENLVTSDTSTATVALGHNIFGTDHGPDVINTNTVSNDYPWSASGCDNPALPLNNVPTFEMGSLGDLTASTAIATGAFVPPPSPRPHAGKNTQSKEQEEMLVRLREANMGFEQIAKEMHAKLGVTISPNALVKRYGKIVDSFLGPLAEATKRAMPDVMNIILRELREQKGTEELTEREKTALEAIQRELPRMVQTRVVRKRKTLLSEASGSPAAEMLE